MPELTAEDQAIIADLRAEWRRSAAENLEPLRREVDSVKTQLQAVAQRSSRPPGSKWRRETTALSAPGRSFAPVSE